MFTYETGDQKEVRRLRIAQFNGRTTTVRSGERTVTGLVRSVLERASSVPPYWTITLIPVAAQGQARRAAVQRPCRRLPLSG